MHYEFIQPTIAQRERAQHCVYPPRFDADTNEFYYSVPLLESAINTNDRDNTVNRPHQSAVACSLWDRLAATDVNEYKVSTKNWRRPVYDIIRRHQDFGHSLLTGFLTAQRKHGYINALRDIKSADERLTARAYRFSSNDEDLCETAKAFSRKIMRKTAGVHDDEQAFSVAAELLDDLGLSFRDELIDEKRESGELRALVNRAADETWIRRQLRRRSAIELERVARDLNLVHRDASPYCSKANLHRAKYRTETNKAMLQNTVAVDESDPDNFFTLFELAAKSPSNEHIRMCEMFTRLRGFEEIAQELGHDATFITATCPSRFHAVSKRETNPKWVEAGKPTTQDAHDYLCGVWQSVRKALDKLDIKFYGMRVVEPHHDGCPHWHMLLFCEPQHTDTIIDVYRRLSLQDSPSEPGAQHRRFVVERIDWSRGSAVGYIAKYLSKNISGHHITSDKDTNLDGTDAANAVRTFARVNGLRQFQFFGGPSVTTWRELRRIRTEFKKDDAMFADLDEAQWFAVESVRRAADAGDWKAFCYAMGGVFVKRNKQLLRPHYHVPHIMDALLEEFVPKKTRFGDNATARITGLTFHSMFILTRFKTWRLESKQRYLRGHQNILTEVTDIFDVLEMEEEYRRMSDARYEELAAQVERYDDLIALALEAESAEQIAWAEASAAPPA
ncbi:replication endonuclease [Salinivibrio sp. VYel4]|uniref:replication endonuclease n=1 Tax=Salinivibrio sp. VYel4 TaxID=2490491 RepID=UPI00128DD849|nr:replication endonuclease [Salinivibrio sp. VYel4]MPY01283.1 replication endonuclease [Salinivibrio sp. VYel4]